MHYWWVNHNMTAQQEIEGGYLWSPKTMRNGRRSQFYENMQATHPGDWVVSFAKSKIGAACKTLSDSDRRKTAQVSAHSGARQLSRF